MKLEYRIFKEKVAALGSTASAAQGVALAEWVIEHLGQDEWISAAEYGWNIPSFYEELSMRCGECAV